MKSIGEFTTEVAIAVNGKDFYYLRSMLAQAHEDYDESQHELVKDRLERAIAPLAPENKTWYKDMLELMRSGGEPDE